MSNETLRKSQNSSILTINIICFCHDIYKLNQAGEKKSMEKWENNIIFLVLMYHNTEDLNICFLNVKSG